MAQPMTSLFIASDHAGFALKQYLIKESGFDMVDLGTHGTESCDYPIFAQMLVEHVLVDKKNRGILICSTGIGMTIAANRHNGIRAALCLNERMANLSRCHNNSNVISFGSSLVTNEAALGCLKVFLETEFEGGRHARRLGLIDVGE